MNKLRKRVILIVYDDPNDRAEVKQTLSELKDVGLLEAEDAMSALKMIDDHEIKVMITDIKMNGMGGIELASKVRNRESAKIPVIFFTGHGDKNSAIEALRMGAFDYIEKEDRNSKLLEAVEKALAICDLELAHRLQRLSLNSTQIKVLEMLMKGMSNKEIAEIVNLSEQGVKYHVGNLFRRFHTTGRNELREKIWGMVNQ